MGKTGILLKGILFIAALCLLAAASAQADDEIIKPDFPDLYDRWEYYEDTYVPGGFGPDWPGYLADYSNRSHFESYWSDILSGYGISAKQVTTFTNFMAADDEDGAFAFLFDLLRAPASNAPISTGKAVARTVMKDIVISSTQTRDDEKKAAAAKQMGIPKMIGGYLRYENVDQKEDKGHVTGASLGMQWDSDNLAFGFLVPYDYFDFESFHGNRIGSIFYAKYEHAVTSAFDFGVTGNINYMFMDIRHIDKINNYGAGLSASLKYDTGLLVPKFAISYQYNRDDTNGDLDDQQMLLAGLSCGIRLGDNAVIEVFSIYSRDVSGYADDFDDTDSFDTGLEVSYSLTDTFGLTGGYKTVLGISGYESHMVYLGARFAFH